METASGAAPGEGSQDEGKSREVRLGLVLYGGVSLAIYIYGVTYEFFRAVRGSGVHRLVKALTDSDIVVDVISGTSAGGINGILLSYALCNGKDLAHASPLWREHGDIRRMLRSPRTEPTDAASLLDSEGYYQAQLERAFADMGDYEPEDGEDPSPLNELDLFITGTDVDGRRYTVVDDAGNPVDVKDHRAVFLLKHRAGRKEPFNPRPPAAPGADPSVTYRALATLCRITSCFPAAFQPVHVQHTAPGEGSADAKLQLWGRLGKEACFLDGGILDNKPFTYTIKAIFSRTADREVNRKLFYVEPDPETFAARPAASRPNFVQAVLAALVGIPGYESIADDLKLLAQHNSRLALYHRLTAELERARSDRREPGPDARPSTVRALYVRTRLVALSERILEGIFRKKGRDDLVPAEHRERAAALARHFDRLQFDAPRLFADFDVEFRLRRLFRITYLIHELLYETGAAVDASRARRYRTLWRTINRQIKLYEVVRAAMEAVVDEAPIAWHDVPLDEIWPTVHAAYTRILHDGAGPFATIREDDLKAALAGTGEWLPQRRLEDVRRGLAALVAEIGTALERSTLTALVTAPGPSLLRRLDRLEGLMLDALVPDPDDAVRQAYEEFEATDEVLLPLEVVGGLREKDIIQTVRISPHDAARGFSRNSYADKVSGDALYHFGAFFKRSWRSNDILWGRLDGLCQLVETLLDRERVRRVVQHDGWRERVRARFFEPDPGTPGTVRWRPTLDPAQLFPRSGAPTHHKIRRWLEALLSSAPEARAAALGDAFDRHIDLLIEAAQLEVIGTEVPNVVADAVEEQGTWNEFLRPAQVRGASGNSAVAPRPPGGSPDTTADAPPWMFQPFGGYLDPLVMSAAATEMARRTREADGAEGERAPRPTETRLGRYFRQSYRVGSETLTGHIPTLVLLEMLATALLVLRACTLGLFGAQADRVRRHLLYRLGVDWPLRAFHAAVVLAARGPRTLVTILSALGLASVLALVLVAFRRSRLLLHPEGTVDVMAVVIFVLVPVAVLVTDLVVLKRLFRRLRPAGAQV